MSDDFLRDLESQLRAAAERRAREPWWRRALGGTPNRTRGAWAPRLAGAAVVLVLVTIVAAIALSGGRDPERDVPAAERTAGGCPTEAMNGATPLLRPESEVRLSSALRREFGESAAQARGIDVDPSNVDDEIELWIRPLCSSDEICLSAVADDRRVGELCAPPETVIDGVSSTFEYRGAVHVLGLVGPLASAADITAGGAVRRVELRVGLLYQRLGPAADVGDVRVEFVPADPVPEGARVVVLNGSGFAGLGEAFEQFLGIEPSAVELGAFPGGYVRRTALYYTRDSEFARSLAERMSLTAQPASDEIRAAGRDADVIVVIGTDAFDAQPVTEHGGITDVIEEPSRAP